MIYLDTSAALAQLLGEDRAPASDIWGEPLIASRLLQYEIWTTLNVRALGVSHGEEARTLLARVAFIELSPIVLERAIEPFPKPVRTLDALHLASMVFLQTRHIEFRLATYDDRLAAAARAIGITVATI